MLNRDMVEECLKEFNKLYGDKNSELMKAELVETKLNSFVIEYCDTPYSFDWDGSNLDQTYFDYVGNELQRLFKAKLNSLDNSEIESPNHYTLPSGKQLIELLQSDLLTRKEFIGFCKGNVYKYVSRYQSKNHREDLEKAKQYLNFLEGLENGQSENE